MRLFLAVDPGERFTADLATRLAPWRERLDVRWTRSETWHLTLQFLGEWPENSVPGLISALGEVPAPEVFSLSPGDLDGFPSLSSPRVLFVQMRDDGSCARLAGEARKAVERVWPDGPQDRRAFRPHLTVARIRRRLDHESAKLLQDIQLGAFDEIPVERFRLVASELRPQGPRYTETAVFPLRKKGE